MLYFGYGSNLCEEDFARWCRERGYAHRGVRPREVGWLPDHEVVFHYHSRARRGGALSVRPRLGSSVPGVIYEVDEEGWAALDAKEGAPDFYARVGKDAITLAGDEVRVTTYEVVEARRRPTHVPPTEAYVETVRRGLAAHALPDEQVVAAAASLETPPLPRAIFVYGTLMRGQLREPQLRRHASDRWEPARARGRLVHLGAYPGLLPDADAEVRGELVALRDPAEALRELDEIEDFLGYGRGGSLYRRVITRARTERGAELAWTYRYLGQGPVIPSGDWRSAGSDG